MRSSLRAYPASDARRHTDLYVTGSWSALSNNYLAHYGLKAVEGRLEPVRAQWDVAYSKVAVLVGHGSPDLFVGPGALNFEESARYAARDPA
jgi:hypothetical protein